MAHTDGRSYRSFPFSRAVRQGRSQGRSPGKQALLNQYQTREAAPAPSSRAGRRLLGAVSTHRPAWASGAGGAVWTGLRWGSLGPSGACRPKPAGLLAHTKSIAARTVPAVCVVLVCLPPRRHCVCESDTFLLPPRPTCMGDPGFLLSSTKCSYTDRTSVEFGRALCPLGERINK